MNKNKIKGYKNLINLIIKSKDGYYAQKIR